MRINEELLEKRNRIKLIVGLGNPGSKYKNNRHNLGIVVVERIAKDHKIRLKTSRSLKSKIAFLEIEGNICILAFPQTYMNCSGGAVDRLVKSKKINPDDILVIYDDLDLDLGVLRFKRKGSSAGHNGIESIIDRLQTNEFNRLRLGIGKPRSKDLTVEYVLSDFTRKEIKEVNSVVWESVDACKMWVKDGIDKAMSSFNKKAL